MSNKRRKATGSTSIARNLAIRIRRGAAKAGTPLPGHSRIYNRDDLDASYTTHGQQLRDELERHTDAYWRGR